MIPTIEKRRKPRPCRLGHLRGAGTAGRVSHHLASAPDNQTRSLPDHLTGPQFEARPAVKSMNCYCCTRPCGEAAHWTVIDDPAEGGLLEGPASSEVAFPSCDRCNDAFHFP